jgi:hypothetical protein
MAGAVLIGVLLLVLREPASWAHTANGACEAGVFEMPSNPLPPQLRQLLGQRASQQGAETLSTLRVHLNELPREFFGDIPVNLNCKPTSYDSAAVNIYFVARDPQGVFTWSRRRITTVANAQRVLVFGESFWAFFDDAWRPILAWRGEVDDPSFLEAFGDYVAELYDFYLEWSIAHELAHVKLGHRTHELPWHTAESRAIESAADIEAARMMRANFRQITPQLLGLIKETMKFEFSRTYGREWRPTDGPAFEYMWSEERFANSRWHITLPASNSTHPPFLIRSIAMLEATSRVAMDQSPGSAWPAAVNALAQRLQQRVQIAPS